MIIIFSGLDGSGKTIYSNSNPFNALTVTGSYALSDALHVDGIFDFSGGSIDAANKAITVSNDIKLGATLC